MNRARAATVGCWIVTALAGGACGGNGSSVKDAPTDAALDAAVDAGPCGAELLFSGAYVDWDTDATFCGIFMATLTVHDDTARTATTAPNGRFQKLCLAPAPTTRVDLAPPTDNSQCTVPISHYTIPGIAVANRAVMDAGGAFSARAWTTDRQTTFFTMIGQVFDPAKAQVLIHVDGPQRPVALAAAHGGPWAITATAWAIGDTGHDVFFPNVDLGAGTTTLSVTGAAIGTGDIPLVAGTITNATVVDN